MFRVFRGQTCNVRTATGASMDDSNARCYHIGGVNILMADSNARCMKDSITMYTWWEKPESFVGPMREDGPGEGQGSVATRPEHRPQEPGSKEDGPMPPRLSIRIGIKASNRPLPF